MSETISVYNMFSPGLSLEFSCIELVNSMNNLLSYCGLVDAKIRASDKDLFVRKGPSIQKHYSARDTGTSGLGLF